MQNVIKGFQRNPDGSWTCIAPVTFDGPYGRRIQVTIGSTFVPGTVFMGVDVAKWLSDQDRRTTVRIEAGASMDQDGWNYEVRVENGWVHTLFRGRMSPDATNKAIAVSAEKARTADDKRVLFDFSNVDFAINYVAESIAQPTVARQLGIDPDFKIAFLSERDFAVAQEIEKVARLRGYTVKAFSNKKEAVEWLRAP
jgi:hypothetical protein